MSDERRLRALVTGGAGFIGSFIAKRLLKAGYQVRVLDYLDSQVHPPDTPVTLPESVEFIEGDIRDRKTLKSSLDGVSVVIHAASAVGVGQSMYRVHHYADVNVGGTALLLELVAEQPALDKLVVLTSMTCYGEGLYRRPSDGGLLRVPIRTEEEIESFGWEPVCPETGESLSPVPIPESAALLARNVYALTKKGQEELSLSIGEAYRIPVVCLRLFNVYGPGQSLTNPYTGVLAIFLSRLLSGRSPTLYEDGFQTRDFVSVHDVVEAVMRVVRTDAANGRVLNIGSGQARSIMECAERLIELTDSNTMPEVTGRFRRGDIRHCTADISLARELIDYHPSVQWEDGLRELVLWARTVDWKDSFEEAHSELERRGLLT